MTDTLRIGFMPLVDSAPLIVAQELGLAAEEGLAFELIKAPSWSRLRDMVSRGGLDAAHMLAPVPVASALGVGGARLDVLSVLSVNGTVVGVSQALATKMRDAGYRFDFADPVSAGRALIAAGGADLRIGVPFPLSMHYELLDYWLSALGLTAPGAIQIRTVPPPLMAEAIAHGEIDAFCVGEPWGSISVETGVGELLLPGAAIWSFAPEKVLAVRHDWAEAHAGKAGRLIRAVWRAGRWLEDPANHVTAAEILARASYVNVASEVIERALSGRLVTSSRGDSRSSPDFQIFHRGAAAFPWQSQADWISHRLARRLNFDPAEALAAGRGVMRQDLFRAALSGTDAVLPAESVKAEGAQAVRTEIAPRLWLEQNQFFDRRVFDLTPTG